MTKLDESDLQKIGESCFCLQSRMTARILTRHYNAILSPQGIEITEFSLLIAIKQGLDNSLTDLADRMAFERSTLVRSLKRMVDRGFLKIAGTTGKAVKYQITREGERLIDRALPLWLEAQEALEKNLPPDAAPEQVLKVLNSLRKAGK